MLSRTLRASCSTAIRVQRQQTLASSRTFITPTAARQGTSISIKIQAVLSLTLYSSPADLVQDLYLSELRKFKPTPIKPSDAEGNVQKFSPPKVPRSPEESNIANELKEYETQQVEVEGQAVSGEAAAPEEDWFEEPEEDEPAHGGH
ncbi:MAG: hypothetical protein M1837_003385 [Sclerophora amabilis]|nr:MAG: hypothetical protein M1837_003385 [Sclerophora amabilis]